MHNSSLDILKHHLGEFFIGNFTVTVGINLFDDLLNHLLIKVLSEGENLFDLGNGDGATTVLIEHLESSLKFVVTQEVLFVQSGNNEFRVFDLT